MTPLGVYSTGSVWASSANDPDGYIQHPNISDNSVFGSLFIELSGNPVDGGSPLCGLNDPSSATCRHIGIHSGANLSSPTHGCIKTENDIVRKIAKNLNGAKVVVTDIELAGDAAPVDFESYDPNFSSPFKITKNDWNPSFSVSALDGQSLGRVHDFGRWWIAEVAKPSGRYEIKSSAAGYQTGRQSQILLEKQMPVVHWVHLRRSLEALVWCWGCHSWTATTRAILDHFIIMVTLRS